MASEGRKERRRSSLITGVAGERRMSANVQQYQVDKMLDPKSLDKIIYQAGVGYTTAGSSRVTTSAGADGHMDFDITGFSAFLSRSKCLSVLLFWKEAEEYLSMFSQKERAACAQKIFQRYLKKGAEYEVNLNGVNDATVDALEKQLGNPPESLFEEVAAALNLTAPCSPSGSHTRRQSRPPPRPLAAHVSPHPSSCTRRPSPPRPRPAPARSVVLAHERS